MPTQLDINHARSLGGRRYVELYGPPGTIESRRKGGLAVQAKLRTDPEFARRAKLQLRKKIKYPQKSSALAEFIGIMLGDGGIRNAHQITISFDAKKDQDYVVYLQNLIKGLFGISSTLYIREKKGRADIVVTSTNLIEFLEKMGIKKGNKVVNQIDVPNWIFESKKYQAACLRGLFDTDGCIYQHRYAINDKRYRYIKMCFRNYSFPILVSVKRMLENLNFNARLDKKQKSVYLHSPSEVSRYFLKIRTNNPGYRNKYNKFFSEKIGRLEGSHSWSSAAVC
ncbi:MAG: LAGLIDADG family homing endonuclease [Candidatus Omnitrophota bacterium]